MRVATEEKPKIAPAPPPPPQSAKRGTAGATPRLTLISSYAFIAFVALVIFDMGLRAAYKFVPQLCPTTAYDSANRSSIWWAVKQYREEPHAPDMVLMGSSLMMAALHNGDATYMDKPVYITSHRHSKQFEDLLEKKFGSPYSTFSFAIGGQMASDAYVLTSTVLSGERRPKAIIYGIAPRDLMDNTLTNVSSTETFHYLSRIGNLYPLAMESKAPLWDALEWTLDQSSCIYGHRSDFVLMQQRLDKSLIAALNKDDLETIRTPLLLRKLTVLELPEDSDAVEGMVYPFGSSPAKYVDNRGEYSARYSGFNKRLFAMQLGFMEKLLKQCQDSGIKLILVNMPLTQDNVGVMPPGLYPSYLNEINRLSDRYHAQFVDLNEPSQFPKTFFGDTVHLNGLGGKKFFELLAERLRTDDKLSATIESIGH